MVTSRTLSPIFSLSCGFFFTTIVIFSLYGFGFYKDSDYFRWGPPVVFFDYKIEEQGVFYGLLTMIFFYQLINNWVYEVVMPWVINTIQNPRHTTLDYSKKVCLAIINANSLYSQLHLAFLINGITSQISFLFAMIIADFITLTFVNWKYIKNKSVQN